MPSPFSRGLLLGLSITAIVLGSFFAGAWADRVFVITPVDYFAARSQNTGDGITLPTLGESASEQSVVGIAESASKSVVTVAVKRKLPVYKQGNSFFGFPEFFGFSVPQQIPDGFEESQEDIGSGFVVEGGLIITNKHVVGTVGETYLVIDKDNNEYEVKKIYRDPVNDLAILQVEADLSALALGDSDALKVGEGVVAIGTALGEFRHTVTTGVVSGLGRGITAGDSFGFETESLENVIQTDAAINPGNSGGPLINFKGEVIGVNVAVSQGAENIGFALPINTIKASLINFAETGSFERAFLGVRYKTISQQAALLNEVPQGAYLVEVAEDSPAAKAGLVPGDIITSFEGVKLEGDKDLLAEIGKKRVGDTISLEVYKVEDKEKKTITVTLEESKGE